MFCFQTFDFSIELLHKKIMKFAFSFEQFVPVNLNIQILKIRIF